MESGKLIVLEGIDGSGKSTQYRLLQERFRQEGIRFHSTVFPRYQEESSALIRLYLSGAFGSKPEDVNACAAAAFYAVDRYAAYKQDWGGIYESGGLILADRYTTSNAVHQGSKVPREELGAFFDWLYDFEYIRLELPRPDMVIYLDVDMKTSLSRIRRRAAAQGERPDIHEQDEHYLRQCLATGKLAAAHYGWQVVAWEKDGREREAEEKSQEIFSLIKKQGLI
ncbi:MAG: deoxynucleoside kinase [Oscillospiraceae bacterium]|nr:deoxynucleoside kinase [Oscillospiraceae bacterium]